MPRKEFMYKLVRNKFRHIRRTREDPRWSNATKVEYIRTLAQTMEEWMEDYVIKTPKNNDQKTTKQINKG